MLSLLDVAAVQLIFCGAYYSNSYFVVVYTLYVLTGTGCVELHKLICRWNLLFLVVFSVCCEYICSTTVLISVKLRWLMGPYIRLCLFNNMIAMGSWPSNC